MVDDVLKRIMYVEDEEDIKKIVKLSLQTLGGFEVLVCSSGREALDKILHFKPELILLDVMMPEMDGPTTLQEIRKIPEFEKTPVMFMTAKAQVHEIMEYKKHEILDVITKPFDPVELPAVIKAKWENSICRA